MEDRQARLTRRLATTLVFLALAGGWAANARADIAYGFASQTISAITITPALGTLSNVAVFTQAGATTNGSGPQNSTQTGSVPQAYQGGTPTPAEDTFTRVAPGFPVPVSSQTPQDFTRGDARITGFPPPGSSFSVVAESFINGTSPKTETGSGGLGASFSFTTTASTTTVSIGYSFASDAYAWIQPVPTPNPLTAASANYQFNITVKDSTGAVVFNSSTANTNLSLTAPPNGLEVTRSGSETVTTGALGAGVYSLNFSLTAQSAANVAAVPEPSVVMLVGAGGALTLGIGAIRRRTRRNVTQ